MKALVIGLDRVVTAEQAQRIKDALNQVLPGVHVVVIGGRSGLAVVDNEVGRG